MANPIIWRKRLQNYRKKSEELEPTKTESPKLASPKQAQTTPPPKQTTGQSSSLQPPKLEQGQLSQREKVQQPTLQQGEYQQKPEEINKSPSIYQFQEQPTRQIPKEELQIQVNQEKLPTTKILPPNDPNKETPQQQEPPPQSVKEGLQRGKTAKGSFDSVITGGVLEESFKTQPIKKKEFLGMGVNASYYVELEDGSRAVVKNNKNDTKVKRLRPSIPEGTQSYREVAAYNVAKVLGLDDLVPTTVLRIDQEGDLSVQQWIDDSTVAGFAGKQDQFDGPRDLARAALFDYLIGQTDRHIFNWILTNKSKLALIDNGLSFPTDKDEEYLNAEIFLEAKYKNLPLPDLSSWKNKEKDLEKALQESKIEEAAIKLVIDKFRILVSGKHQSFETLFLTNF